MYSNQRYGRQPMGFDFGGRPPRDVLVLLAILLITYSMQYFGATQRFMEGLQLSSDVWARGYVWQLATYAFIAQATGLWFLVTLMVVFWFSRDVLRALGRQSFWRLLAWSILTSSVVAVVVGFLLSLVGLAGPFPFVLMQGPRILTAILVAAFATLYGNATIMLFFVIPFRARSFLWLEVLVAFLLFLPTKDFAGFVGISVSVGTTYSILTTGNLRRSLKEIKLRIERRYLELKMKRMRDKRGMRIVKGDDDVHRGPWVN